MKIQFFRKTRTFMLTKINDFTVYHLFINLYVYIVTVYIYLTIIGKMIVVHETHFIFPINCKYMNLLKNDGNTSQT